MSREDGLLWSGDTQAQGAFLGDGAPNLLGLPAGARPRTAVNGAKLDRASAQVVATLRQLAAGLQAAAEEGGPPRRYEIDELSNAERAVLFDALGEGEANAIVSGEYDIQMQETVLPGLWRVQMDREGVVQEWFEIADVPSAVRDAVEARALPVVRVPGAAPEGVMNAPAILFEIASKMQKVEPSAPNEVINFSLLPLSPVDAAWIPRVLGVGPVKAMSTGFGDCRITATAYRNVWSVQYLNAMGTVILDTIEIGGVPQALCAGHNDFEDSASRLVEIIQAYAS